MESERRKADEFRSQHDEYERRLLELQKAAKKETHQIVSISIIIKCNHNKCKMVNTLS